MSMLPTIATTKMDTNMAFYVSKHTRQEQYRINQRRKYTLSLASLRQLHFGTSARKPI